jgi:hypothetical protein
MYAPVDNKRIRAFKMQEYDAPTPAPSSSKLELVPSTAAAVNCEGTASAGAASVAPPTDAVVAGATVPGASVGGAGAVDVAPSTVAPAAVAGAADVAPSTAGAPVAGADATSSASPQVHHPTSEGEGAQDNYAMTCMSDVVHARANIYSADGDVCHLSDSPPMLTSDVVEKIVAMMENAKNVSDVSDTNDDPAATEHSTEVVVKQGGGSDLKNECPAV